MSVTHEEQGQVIQPPAVPSGSTPTPTEAAETGAAMDETATVVETVSTTDARIPVTLSQVIACAKKTCKTCFGKGTFMVTRVVDRNGAVRRTVDTCGCAQRRFFKLHPHVEQDPVTKAWFWPPSAVVAVDETTPQLE